VAPDNYKSLHNCLRQGFVVRKTIVKPGGQVRYLLEHAPQ
jgi:predicted transcriptional regulator